MKYVAGNYYFRYGYNKPLTFSPSAMRVVLMLPAYNEELSLGALLLKAKNIRNAKTGHLEILIVNDGSTDGTMDVARAADVAVLDLQPNRGLAGAMRAGFTKLVAELDADDCIVTMDADDSHDPAMIPDMLLALAGGADIAIASRYRKGARIVGLSRWRQFLSSGAGVLYRISTPMKGVRDFTCGYRAYKVVLLKRAMDHYGERFIEQQGFACMAEILLKLRVFRPVVKEFPMILRYDQKKGASKMNIWKTIRSSLSIILGRA